MKRKILSFILVLCLLIPCSFMFSGCAENMPTTKVNTENINSIINSEQIEGKEWTSQKFLMESGDYDKITLTKTNTKSGGEGTSTSPYIFNKSLTDIHFVGDDARQTKVQGFDINNGYAVKYVNQNGSGGVDYYEYKTYDIGTLKFQDLTFVDNINITSVYKENYSQNPSVKINNIIFENVTFDLQNNTTANNGAFHLISENSGIKNLIFNNCKFLNCRHGTTFNGVAVDCRTTDNINITINNCEFDKIGYNAIQLAGSNSSFTGNINITNNKINDTGDRALRFSKIGQGAMVKINDNIMTNASRTNGELCAATVEDKANVTISHNYWGAKNSAEAVKGMVNGENVIEDTNPRQSVN